MAQKKLETSLVCLYLSVTSMSLTFQPCYSFSEPSLSIQEAKNSECDRLFFFFLICECVQSPCVTNSYSSIKWSQDITAHKWERGWPHIHSPWEQESLMSATARKVKIKGEMIRAELWNLPFFSHVLLSNIKAREWKRNKSNNAWFLGRIYI